MNSIVNRSASCRNWDNLAAVKSGNAAQRAEDVVYYNSYCQFITFISLFFFFSSCEVFMPLSKDVRIKVHIDKIQISSVGPYSTISGQRLYYGITKERRHALTTFSPYLAIFKHLLITFKRLWLMSHPMPKISFETSLKYTSIHQYKLPYLWFYHAFFVPHNIYYSTEWASRPNASTSLPLFYEKAPLSQ